MWFRKKEVSHVELDDVESRVGKLEERVDAVTEVLLNTLEDPWSQNILRRIHDK